MAPVWRASSALSSSAAAPLDEAQGATPGLFFPTTADVPLAMTAFTSGGCCGAGAPRSSQPIPVPVAAPVRQRMRVGSVFMSARQGRLGGGFAERLQHGGAVGGFRVKVLHQLPGA